MLLKNTPDNRAKPVKCTQCEQTLPGAMFFCITEKPELRGKTTIHLDRTNKVLEKYHRTAWSTRAIDTDKPCKTCRARNAARKSIAKAKARIESLRAEVIAKHIELGAPIPETLIRRKKNGTGPDPVLQSCAVAIGAAKQQMQKEGVHAAAGSTTRASVTAGNTQQDNTAPHPYHKWLRRLFEARIAVYEDVRERRKLDLQIPLTANDAQRTHMLAYIRPEDRDVLDAIAAKVNYYRPVTRGKPYKGLPIINPLMPLDPTKEEQAVAALREAWQPFKDAISLTLRASRSAVRDRHRARPNSRLMQYRKDSAPFTMEQYHMKRIECAQLAQREIERCIAYRVHPQAYRRDRDDEPRSLRTWGPLVPSLAYQELRDMWLALPDVVQARARPFPMLRPTLLRYQITKGLTKDGVPVSDRLERQ